MTTIEAQDIFRTCLQTMWQPPDIGQLPIFRECQGAHALFRAGDVEVSNSGPWLAAAFHRSIPLELIFGMSPIQLVNFIGCIIHEAKAAIVRLIFDAHKRGKLVVCYNSWLKSYADATPNGVLYTMNVLYRFEEANGRDQGETNAQRKASADRARQGRDRIFG